MDPVQARRSAFSFSAGVLVGALALFVATTPWDAASTPRRLAAAPRRLSGTPRGLMSLPHHVLWNDSVLPDNIIDQRLPSVVNPNYGLHVFALGKNGSLFHKFQTGPIDMTQLPYPIAPMSEWHCLTPNASKIWGNDPAVEVNQDGHIELFVGFKQDSYDLWQMYQTDPKNPLAWSQERGPTCMCDAVSPTACPWCTNCNERYDCYKNYWLDHAPFTTGDPELIMDKTTGMLNLLFRNFDGHMYRLSQREPNNSTRWSFDSVQFAIFE